MSQRLISRSDDLRRLAEEGFELEVRGPYLLVHHIPYADEAGHVEYGTLIVTLALADDATVPPTDHTAKFIGDAPCDAQGRRLTRMINGGRDDLGHGLVADFSFSAKPRDGYRDHHHKVTAYVARLSGPAKQIDPSVDARGFGVIVSADSDSPFRYVDTATPRAGLERYAERLATMELAIVGLGGTGSYILDLVAKTSVARIHLYDGDRFHQHNAFRSPGATPGSALRGAPNKANHWAKVYARMRRGVRAHPSMVDATNVAELRSMDFVFIAIDDGRARELIVGALEEYGVACIDVGLGIHDIDEHLSGTTRVSVATAAHRMDRQRLPVHAAGPDNDYRHNIQIADLNAVNAAFAVIKWKKLVGIYADLEREHFAAYATALNSIVNEDRA